MKLSHKKQELKHLQETLELLNAVDAKPLGMDDASKAWTKEELKAKVAEQVTNLNVVMALLRS